MQSLVNKWQNQIKPNSKQNKTKFVESNSTFMSQNKNEKKKGNLKIIQYVVIMDKLLLCK